MSDTTTETTTDRLARIEREWVVDGGPLWRAVRRQGARLERAEGVLREIIDWSQSDDIGMSSAMDHPIVQHFADEVACLARAYFEEIDND